MAVTRNSRISTAHILKMQCTLLLCSLVVLIVSCGGKDDASQSSDNSDWDIEKNGIPKFVATDYIELAKIYRISKFRSSVGHDYSDAFEHCRSMKHYFEPRSDVDWAAIKLFSPVTGKITRLDQEWAGTKIEIESNDYPAFRFSIFHVTLTAPRNINENVSAGEQLGTHIGSQTMSDIAVMVNDPTHQGRLISYFDVMSDTLFSEYVKRGVNSREDMMISKAIRDSLPLTCVGDSFASVDTLENWVLLK